MPITESSKRLLHRMLNSKHMLSFITVASLLESIIVPIPLEAVLIPLMQARRDKLWMIALMVTLGCIMGALIGYIAGYFLFGLIGEWIINAFSSPEQFANIKQNMDEEGFWFVLTVGIVPIPFQIAMLAAGATQFSIFLFLFATLIARSIRYFGLAIVVYYTGNHAEALVKRYKYKAVIVLAVIALCLWWLSNQL